MSKLEEAGIICGEDGEWGSKRRYLTKEAFAEALSAELNYTVSAQDIGEAYMRYQPHIAEEDRGVYEPEGYWLVVDGPGRGATPVWEYA